MSRIGKKVIKIPKDVSVVITDKTVNVKGKHGSLEREFNDLITLNIEDNELFVNSIVRSCKNHTPSYHPYDDSFSIRQ